jgi:hypothetical protein
MTSASCGGAALSRGGEGSTFKPNARDATPDEQEEGERGDSRTSSGDGERARSLWPQRRDALLAEYRHFSPASQEERDRAEHPEATPGPEADWILDEERTSGARVVAWCREQVSYPSDESLEGCDLGSLGGGAVLLLTLITECGGDSCSTEGYIDSEKLGQFVRVPHDVGGGAEASPSGDALFVTSVTDVAFPAEEGATPRDPWGGSEPLILTRVAVPSMESEPFAPCFSPTLSPQGGWILCRDLGANVLKVPLAGGKPTVLATSGLKAGEAYFVWYAYLWPDAVEFIGNERLKFRVVPADGEAFERELGWEE